VKQAKDLLRVDCRFTVEPRTRHTYFHPQAHNPIEIEVLCYPSTFKITFNSETEILDMNGIRLLHPVTLLNSKCDAVIQRSSMSKREPDTDDITFILLLAIERGMRFDLDEVLSASEDLQNTLEHLREGIKQLFQAVGL
jgi:hypothetical protein